MLDDDEMHVRHCMLYEFKKGNTAATATRNILKTFGKKSVQTRKVQRWFARFRSGNFQLDNIKRSGRPRIMDIIALNTLIEAEPNLTSQELPMRLNKSRSSVLRHLHLLGKVSKYGKWIPKELDEANLSQRRIICTSLLSRQEIKPFLKQIITSDFKWIIYYNKMKPIEHQHNESVAVRNCEKPPPKKCLLSIWWDVQGIIYYDLFKPDVIITPELYNEQLTYLYESLKVKRSEQFQNNTNYFILQNDNTKPDISKIIYSKIKLYNWELLLHPPLSPDLIPSNYYLIKHLQNYLDDQILENELEAKNAIDQFFSSKTEEFYRNGIEMLPKLWNTIIDNDGKYIINED